MATETVPVSEFKDNLSSYLESEDPLKITQFGKTIGLYLPALRNASEADQEALKEATIRWHNSLREQGITEDDIIDDFEKWRKDRYR